jgi:hypothetical protein
MPTRKPPPNESESNKDRRRAKDKGEEIRDRRDKPNENNKEAGDNDNK